MIYIKTQVLAYHMENTPRDTPTYLPWRSLPSAGELPAPAGLVRCPPQPPGLAGRTTPAAQAVQGHALTQQQVPRLDEEDLIVFQPMYINL